MSTRPFPWQPAVARPVAGSALGVLALAFSLGAWAAAGTAATETYTTVALPTASLNLNLASGTGGEFYGPLFDAGEALTLNGVPFDLGGTASSNNVIVDPSEPVVIPIGLTGQSTVYTLINSRWGSPRATIGALTFTWSSGRQDTVQLIVGANVRDHFYGTYTNTLSDASVTLGALGGNAPGTPHLDMQAFALPLGTRELTLTSLTFSSTHMGRYGVPFLAGVTVGQPVVPTPVPEPESLGLLLAGVGVAAGWVRRRRRTPH